MSKFEALNRRRVLAAAGALAFTPALALAKENKPQPLPADQAKLITMITGSGKPILLPASTVHIPTFRVELVRQITKTAETTGFAAAGRASQTSTYSLNNVNEAQLAALTQALYDELVASLTALGHTVATPDQTRADADLGPLMTGVATPFFAPTKHGMSSFYAPRGLNVVMEPLDVAAAAGDPMAGFAGAQAMMQRGLAVNKAVGRKLAVIQAKYSVTFVDLTSSTDGAFGRMTDVASISASLGLRIVPELTRWDVMAPAANRNGLTGGHYHVDTQLTVPGATFADGGNVAGGQQGAAAANLLSAAVGSANVYGASSRAVLPTPLFQPAAQSALSTVQKGFITRITTASR